MFKKRKPRQRQDSNQRKQRVERETLRLQKDTGFSSDDETEQVELSRESVVRTKPGRGRGGRKSQKKNSNGGAHVVQLSLDEEEEEMDSDEEGLGIRQNDIQTYEPAETLVEQTVAEESKRDYSAKAMDELKQNTRTQPVNTGSSELKVGDTDEVNNVESEILADSEVKVAVVSQLERSNAFPAPIESEEDDEDPEMIEWERQKMGNKTQPRSLSGRKVTQDLSDRRSGQVYQPSGLDDPDLDPDMMQKFGKQFRSQVTLMEESLLSSEAELSHLEKEANLFEETNQRDIAQLAKLEGKAGELEAYQAYFYNLCDCFQVKKEKLDLVFLEYVKSWKRAIEMASSRRRRLVGDLLYLALQKHSDLTTLFTGANEKLNLVHLLSHVELPLLAKLAGQYEFGTILFGVDKREKDPTQDINPSQAYQDAQDKLMQRVQEWKQFLEDVSLGVVDSHTIDKLLSVSCAREEDAEHDALAEAEEKQKNLRQALQLLVGDVNEDFLNAGLFVEKLNHLYEKTGGSGNAYHQYIIANTIPDLLVPFTCITFVTTNSLRMDFLGGIRDHKLKRSVLNKVVCPLIAKTIVETYQPFDVQSTKHQVATIAWVEGLLRPGEEEMPKLLLQLLVDTIKTAREEQLLVELYLDQHDMLAQLVCYELLLLLELFSSLSAIIQHIFQKESTPDPETGSTAGKSSLEEARRILDAILQVLKQLATVPSVAHVRETLRKEALQITNDITTRLEFPFKSWFEHISKELSSS